MAEGAANRACISYLGTNDHRAIGERKTDVAHWFVSSRTMTEPKSGSYPAAGNTSGGYSG